MHEARFGEFENEFLSAPSKIVFSHSLGHLRKSKTLPAVSALGGQADIIRRKADIEFERQLSAVIVRSVLMQITIGYCTFNTDIETRRSSAVSSQHFLEGFRHPLRAVDRSAPVGGGRGQRAFLIHAHQPRVAGHVGSEYGGEAAFRSAGHRQPSQPALRRHQ